MRRAGVLLYLVSAVASAAAGGPDAPCGGYNTVLYSDATTALTICHGRDSRFSRSALGRWQDCGDAVISIRDKREGATRKYADCTPMKPVQFKVDGKRFLVRYFYTRYPGFETRPLLVESLDLAHRAKTYRLQAHFASCTEGAVAAARQRIDSAVSKPFDGRTYFAAVYGGFYKLRDCSASQPKPVLAILRAYRDKGVFDGEVAETLDEVTDEVELIARAVR